MLVQIHLAVKGLKVNPSLSGFFLNLEDLLGTLVEGDLDPGSGWWSIWDWLWPALSISSCLFGWSTLVEAWLSVSETADSESLAPSTSLSSTNSQNSVNALSDQQCQFLKNLKYQSSKRCVSLGLCTVLSNTPSCCSSSKSVGLCDSISEIRFQL